MSETTGFSAVPQVATLVGDQVHIYFDDADWCDVKFDVVTFRLQNGTTFPLFAAEMVAGGAEWGTGKYMIFAGTVSTDPLPGRTKPVLLATYATQAP